MLSMRQHYDDAGNPTKLEFLGDPQPSQRFSTEFLREMDNRYVEHIGDTITLRDDTGRVLRYRVTADPIDADMVTAELITTEQ